MGALVGSALAAALFGILGQRARERDSVIGVVLAFGLGLAVLFIQPLPGPDRDQFRVAHRPDRRGGLLRAGHAGAGLRAGSRRADDVLSPAAVRHRRPRGGGRAWRAGPRAGHRVRRAGRGGGGPGRADRRSAVGDVAADHAGGGGSSGSHLAGHGDRRVGASSPRSPPIGGIVLSLAPGVPVSVFVATISFLIYLVCWLLGRHRSAAA